MSNMREQQHDWASEQIDEVEMQKNEWAREEAKRINNGGEPGKYTPEIWTKIKEYLK